MQDISVIVPVYNHWHLIPNLLQCLAKQTLGVERFELLLVDNASTVLAIPEELPSWVQILSCSTPGSYAARNRALEVARGTLLVFTDADCLPQPQWLESLVHAFAGAPDKLVVAGSILVEPESWAAPNVYELYDVALGLPQKRYVCKSGFGVTANLTMPKALLRDVGGFDSRRYSGGDADFCRRATASGARLDYCESAMVIHPARRTWQELAKKVRRLKGGQVKSGTLRQRLRFAVSTFLPPVHVWKVVLRSPRLTRWQGLRVCVLHGGLWLVGMVEFLRLVAGGQPRRE